MSEVVNFLSRDAKVRDLKGQIDEWNQRRADLIAAAPDDALLEVRSVLAREMTAGGISLNYSGVMQELEAEIARRNLNVIQFPDRKEAS
jgi:hypothetical protein